MLITCSAGSVTGGLKFSSLSISVLHCPKGVGTLGLIDFRVNVKGERSFSFHKSTRAFMCQGSMKPRDVLIIADKGCSWVKIVGHNAESSGGRDKVGWMKLE